MVEEEGWMNGSVVEGRESGAGEPGWMELSGSPRNKEARIRFEHQSNNPLLCTLYDAGQACKEL